MQQTDVTRSWILHFLATLAAVTSEGRSMTATVLADPSWDQVANFCFMGSGVTYARHTGSLLARPPASCKDLKAAGQHFSGVYIIYRCTMKLPVAIPVFCDMATDGGGWTVIQRRTDGSQDFALNWRDYKDGFGDLEHEFWLGNDFISQLTAYNPHELRVDLEDFSGERAYAKYSNFSVAPAYEQFKLNVSGYSGNAGNSLEYVSGMKFSTPDQDHDTHGDNSKHCARYYSAGWWYKDCIRNLLNGIYYSDGAPGSNDSAGIYWRDFVTPTKSLKGAKMMIRPKE